MGSGSVAYAVGTTVTAGVRMSTARFASGVIAAGALRVALGSVASGPCWSPLRTALSTAVSGTKIAAGAGELVADGAAVGAVALLSPAHAAVAQIASTMANRLRMARWCLERAGCASELWGGHTSYADAASSNGVAGTTRQVARNTPSRMIAPPTISSGVGRSFRSTTAWTSANTGTR